MIYTLVFLNIIITAFQGITTKFFSENYPGKKSDSSTVFSVIVGVLVSLSVIALGATVTVTGITDPIIRPEGFDLTVVGLGILRSLTVIAYTYCLMTASAKGPYSQLTIFSMCGAITVPIIVDLCFGIFIEYFKYAAMLVMILSFFLICRPAKDEEKPKKGFYLACMGVFASNGIYGAIVPAATYIKGDEMGHEIIVTTYVSSALISLIMLLFSKKKEIAGAFKLNRKAVLFALVTAAIIASTSILGIVSLTGFGTIKGISGALNMSMLCGGVMVSSELLSKFMLKERFSLVKWLGIALATASIVVLTL